MKTFAEYHKNNPEVWELFRVMTFRAIRKGFRHYSSKGIFELIRWETQTSLKDDGYKVNNNYTPDYARMFENEYPQYKAFFETRSLKKQRQYQLEL